MTRIYAAGVRATALANITSDVAAFISFNSSGVKVLDVEGLVAALLTQFRAISTDAEFVAPATADSSAAAAKAVDVRALVSSLANTINERHWTSRSDWPTTTDVLSGAALVTAVKDGSAECERLSAAIGAYYDDLGNSLADKLTDYYYAQGIDALVPAGVVRNIESRSYLFTWVTDRNEESAPSPASALLNFDQNDTAGITVPSPPAGRFITHFRPYCSTSSNTSANFDYVPCGTDTKGWPIASLSITDSKKPSEREEPCPTTTWAEPSARLIALTEGPNGGMAGIIEGSNEVGFCENFIGYAWPVEYRKTTAWPPVGIGRFGQTYVVLTRGKPYYMTGADSASLDSQPIDSNQACVSRRSIVNIEGGVIYASPDGLCLASASGIALLTENHFSRDDWQALVPSSIFATERDGAYIFHYSTGAASGCYALDLKTGKLTTIDATGSAFYRDMVNDTTYLASGTAINALFSAGTCRTATWKSKKAVLPSYANLGWLKVESEYEANVTVKLYRDGVLTDTKVLSTRAPVRLSSVRALEHEVQIESAARVTALTLTSSTEEMRQV